MGVYLPTAAVGNGKVLCTIGGAGEIMTFFYPHIDFAQNVRQLLSALYLGDPGHGRFLWTFDDEFQHFQQYDDRANVLHTTLVLPGEQVTLAFTDFCPPDGAALVRRVRLETGADRPFQGTFLSYFELRINEVTGKQAVQYMMDEGMAVQYFRDVAIAVGGRRPSVWRCGKSIDEGPRSAKSDLYDGHLNGQPEDIGQVDFALGWHISMAAGEAREFDIIIGGGREREEAIARVKRLTQTGSAELERRTVEDDAAWLESLAEPQVAAPFDSAYRRALLSMRILQDTDSKAVIAAPEFDPAYELCGGYGYCWPRDATDAVMALRMAGGTRALAELADWYVTTQLPSGQWGQRYWTCGRMASSWALREDFLQVDQTAAALIAVCADALDPARPDEAREDLLARRWPAVERGAQALAAMVGPDGWHSFACDLWETFCGTFVYTNAAIYAALREAGRMAAAAGEQDLAAEWEELCARMKQATIALHNGQHFPRGILGDGRPDMVVDSSTLGVSEPFGMLSPDVPEERRLIETNLQTIEERLNFRMDDGGVGIRRYEGDGYLGGVIGCVNTLWFALVCLQLARSYDGEDDARAAALREKAEGYMRFALDHATPTGLLPELIGTRPEYPYWAAPHSWASGLLVKCVLAAGGEPLSSGPR